jgi:hypothetical protein
LLCVASPRRMVLGWCGWRRTPSPFSIGHTLRLFLPHLFLSVGAASLLTKVNVRVTLRLADYREPVRLDAKPLEDHDQRFFYD